MSVKPGMVFISLKYSSSFISSYKKSTLAKPEHSRILNISLAYSLILSFVSFFRSALTITSVSLIYLESKS
jgi:hypothetical protein